MHEGRNATEWPSTGGWAMSKKSDYVALIRQLRENPATQAMRIVLVTTHTAEEVARFGAVPDGVPLLHKPVSAEALEDALRG